MAAFPCLLATESKDKKREWTQIFADLGHPQEIAILDKKPRLVEIQDIDVVRVCATKDYDVWRKLGKPALVEDTGIEIEALNGYPGALYQSVQKGMGNIGLLQAMRKNDAASRRAQLVTASAHVTESCSNASW
jgi:inosine/xanthosine triphosphate pyrophosphatase family protein